MLVDIDPNSEVALYQQLRDRLVEAIAEGRLREGDRLASVRQVAVAFGINVATVGKGYDLLRQEGLVRTNRKAGSTIARDPHSGPAADDLVAEWSERLRTLVAEAEAQGIPAAHVLLLSRRFAEEFERARAHNAPDSAIEGDQS